MDPIKNLISASDPLKSGDPIVVPDAETVLRGIVTDNSETVDRMPPTVISLADVRRRRAARIAGLATIAVAAVAAGVLVVSNLGSLTVAPAPADTAVVTVEPTATASATPTATATASQAALVAWKTFTDSTQQGTFELPANWSTVESPRMIAGMPFNKVSVRNAENKQVAALEFHYDLAGGSCTTPRPFDTLDAVELDIAQKPDKVKEFSAIKGAPLGLSRFTFTVVEADKVYASIGLSEATQVQGTPGCTFRNMITAPENVPFTSFADTIDLYADGTDAPLMFDSVADARTYMQTQEYQDLKRMMVSLSLKPSKVQTSTVFTSQAAKVRFSLPTGWTTSDVPMGNSNVPASGIDVADERGKTVARLAYGSGGGLGGACGQTYPVTELDTSFAGPYSSWALERGVRFSYRVLDQTFSGKGLLYGLGLVDKDSGGLGANCSNTFYTLVTGAPRGSLSFTGLPAAGGAEPVFATMQEARAYMASSEYSKLKEMIVSLQEIP
ncbi:hypothetical protein [Arthrobacter sp. 35W]|uniref:hypothetical protein n=1 Tax=Arthrobacter sp. 35W TaxID=1132441 RepID=UPI00040C796E|nr:hypothetical protein [Arthrobacter sp. 35W]